MDIKRHLNIKRRWIEQKEICRIINQSNDEQLRQFRSFRIGERIADILYQAIRLPFKILLYLGYLLIASAIIYVITTILA